MNISSDSSHVVYVSSVDRLNGTSSNFTYNVNFPSDLRYNKVVVLDALIPKSYYLIQDGYNTFLLTENSTTVTVTMPVGDYTYNAFKIVTAATLTSASPNHWVYTCTSPNQNTGPDTGKFTWHVSGNASQPSITFQGNTMWENFGFNADSTNVFTANSLTSVNVPKLQIEDRVFIVSNMVVGSSNQKAILQEINSAPSPSFSSIVYQCTCPDYYSKYINSATSSTFSFALIDEHGEPIDLNGLNFGFTLLFYQENDVFSKLKKFMALVGAKLLAN